jgi:small subunit ribosomal protein S5
MITDLKEINKSKHPIKSQSKQFIERIINISRVSKVTKGGKKLSFRAIIVIGNEKGQVGVGVAKANDVQSAVKKAKNNGLKHLINVPITKSFSIPHDISNQIGACKLIMRPSKEGSGVIAGGAIRIVLEIVGIKNIIAKQLGSNNLLNNARLTISSLKKLRTISQVSKERNINLKLYSKN